MQNSSIREPKVSILDSIGEGNKILEKHIATFFVASFLAVGTIVVVWQFRRRMGIDGGTMAFLVMTLFGPFHAGLCYMGLKAMRKESPRVWDMFRGFQRCWGVFAIWLVFPVGLTVIGASSGVALLFVPILWAMGMLAIPLFIDRELSVAAAMSTAFETVLTWKNWWRFWLYGMAFFCLSYIGLAACAIGVCYTLPLSVCAQMVAYSQIIGPDEIAALSKDQQLPFQITQLQDRILGRKSRPRRGANAELFQITQLRDGILEAINSANKGVKPLLESSTEQIGSVVSKAADLVNRLDQIEEYLRATSGRSLRREKGEIKAKIEATSNADVVLQYQEVLKALNERLANHKHMKDLAAKIRAQLTTIRISLDNTLAKVIQIKTADVNSASLERDGFSRDLESLRDEMDVLLDSLNEMERSSR